MSSPANQEQRPQAATHLSVQGTATTRQKAVDNARAAFAKLPREVSENCAQGDTITQLIQTLSAKYGSHKKSKIVRRFQQHSAWLVNFSNVVDVAVQTQAGIACPIWAPMKFVLQLSEYHSEIVEHISTLIETMSSGLARFSIYEQLNDDPILQTALINIYTCIIDFSSCVIQYLSRGRLKKLFGIVATHLRRDLATFNQRLQKLSLDADNAAIATELLRASRAREEEAQRKTEDLLLKINNWLRPSNQEEVLGQFLQEQLSGTCQWIWHHPKFLDWQQSSDVNRLLQVSGKHGCGKSVMASAVTQAVRAREEHVLFFSFSSMDTTRQSHTDLARSFVWQLLQHPSRQSLEIVRELMLRNQPLSSDLWEAFSKMAPQHPMIWVIDGLDECRQPSSESFALITSLLASHQNARAIVFGRPSAFESFTNSIAVEITSELTSADIEAYIHHGIAQSRNMGSAEHEIQTLAQHALQTRSDGMFLWVKFAFHDLSKPASNAVLKERLCHLPHGLIQTYRHLLSALVRPMDDTDKRLGHHLLSLIVAARRPMKLKELQYAEALVYWSDKRCPGPFALSEYAVPDFARHLHDLCGNLITISGDAVSLTHASVKEYLLRPEAEWTHSDDNAIACLRVDPDRANGLVLPICLRYWETKTKALMRLEEVRQFIDSSTYLNWATYYQTHILFNDAAGVCADDFFEFISWSEENDHTSDLHGKVIQAYESWQERIDQLLQRTFRADSFEETSGGETGIPPNDPMQVYGSTQQEMVHSLIQKSSVAFKMPHFALGVVRKFLGMKSLADPLELLFRAILQAQVPVPVLLGIGEFYESVQKPEKALEVFRVATRRSDHQSYWGFVARCDLAGVLLQPLDRVAEAAECYRQLLPECERILDKQSHGRSRTRLSRLAIEDVRNYGNVLYRQQQWDETEKIDRLAMRYSTKLLGEKDKETLIIMHNLGCVLHEQAKYSEAADLFYCVVETQKDVLGEEDGNALNSMGCYGRALCMQQSFQKAEEILSQAIDSATKVLGNEDERTLSIMYWLGVALYCLGRYIEAEEVLLRTVNNWIKVLGNEHEDTLYAMYYLGRALFGLERYTEAEEVLSRTVNSRLKVLGNEHGDTLDAMCDLGETLSNLGRYAEAASVFWNELRGRCKTLGNNDPTTLLSLQHLVRVQRQQDNESDDLARETQSEDGSGSWESESTCSTCSSEAATI